jgi:uncharacterized protein
MFSGVTYVRRVLDDELDLLFADLAAIAIEGPKGVGKTATASQRAATIFQLDRASQRALFDANPDRLTTAPTPVLLDEWQRHPPVWDLVRRAVDNRPVGGQFLLAGSASPLDDSIHSGAGRIVRLRMRPMSMVERALEPATVSLRTLLAGTAGPLDGQSSLDLGDYVDEIVASGFPAVRNLSTRARTAQLDGYIARVVNVEFLENGHRLYKPASLNAWLMAYAAATATNAAYSVILDAATPGDGDKPAKTTTMQYRDMLTRLFLTDPVPGWLPALNPLDRLAQAPKHHLCDPALSCRLLGISAGSLLASDSATNLTMFDNAGPDGFLLGRLFESLATLCVRVYAQHAEGTVHHLRTKNGDHEVDLIVEGSDRRVVAIEVKLSPVLEDRDVQHLLWLRGKLGSKLADAIVVTTGQHAYRRRDGIGVVPLSLLGP